MKCNHALRNDNENLLGDEDAKRYGTIVDSLMYITINIISGLCVAASTIGAHIANVLQICSSGCKMCAALFERYIRACNDVEVRKGNSSEWSHRI